MLHVHGFGQGPEHWSSLTEGDGECSDAQVIDAILPQKRLNGLTVVHAEGAMAVAVNRS